MSTKSILPRMGVQGKGLAALNAKLRYCLRMLHARFRPRDLSPIVDPVAFPKRFAIPRVRWILRKCHGLQIGSLTHPMKHCQIDVKGNEVNSPVSEDSQESAGMGRAETLIAVAT